MAGVVLLGGEPAESAAMAGLLRARGHDVAIAAAAADVAGLVGGRQAIVSDLDAAIGAGWLRPSTPMTAPLPLIVTSPHEAFLDVVRNRVAATVPAPVTDEALDEAILRVTSGQQPTVPASPGARSRLDDPARDAAIHARGLADVHLEPELLAIAALVARGTGADIALLTVLDSRRQTFLGHSGLPPDFAAGCSVRREWSFCQSVVESGAALLVPDLSLHPALAGLPLVEADLMRGYAGVPVEIEGLGAIGTVCVLSREPRTFGGDALAVLNLAARLASAWLSKRGRTIAPPPPFGASERRIGIGDLLGEKYWITAELGRGGQSDVFLARDRLLGQLVAIKWMRERDEERLKQEATALASVRHPNIVQLHGWGRAERGELYLVLEYVDGETLDDAIARMRAEQRPIPTRRVIDVVCQLAGALASMHAAGYVHGDVKPANVILDPALDRAVLIDFGFPLSVQREGPEGERGTPPSGGTPGYSAPEQFVDRGESTHDPRLDVYALGAVAYAMLVGEGPFASGRGRDRLAMQLVGEVPPPSLRRPGLPREVDAVLLSALAVDPAARPARVLDLADALANALNTVVGEPPVVASKAEPHSRGIAFRAYRAEVRRRFGDAEDSRALAALDDESRAVVLSATEDEQNYLATPLVSYLRAVAGHDLERIVTLADGLSEVALPMVIRELRVNRTPETLIYVGGTLLGRFHDWGRVEVTRLGPTLARTRLTMPPDFAPVMCTYFAAVMRALLSTTGRQCSVSQVACSAQGADACEFLVTWSSR